MVITIIINKKNTILVEGGHGKLLLVAVMATSAILAIVFLVTRLVSLFMHRRGERYRQALLASKNSIIYQKLSEEISAPQTPKIHRYAPINQV